MEVETVDSGFVTWYDNPKKFMDKVEDNREKIEKELETQFGGDKRE